MLEPFWERSKCCFLRSESQDGVHPATDLAKARPTLGGRYLVDTFEPSNGRRKLCGIQALIRRLPFCGLSLSENGYKDREANDEGRSEERRVGKECVSTCRSRWSPDH